MYRFFNIVKAKLHLDQWKGMQCERTYTYTLKMFYCPNIKYTSAAMFFFHILYNIIYFLFQNADTMQLIYKRLTNYLSLNNYKTVPYT